MKSGVLCCIKCCVSFARCDGTLVVLQEFIVIARIESTTFKQYGSLQQINVTVLVSFCLFANQ